MSTAGLTLALSVAIGVGVGVLLDRWLKTNWLVIVFTLFGVAAGFKQLIQTVIRANAEQERMEAEERQRRRAAPPAALNQSVGAEDPQEMTGN